MTDAARSTLERVDQLVARAGALSFAADDEVAELRGLVAEAEAPEGSDRGRWIAARDELAAFFERVHEDAAHVAVLRSGTATTWVGWGGDTVSVVGAGESVDDHVGTLVRTIRGRLSRLRILTLLLEAAARVAVLFTVPGAGFLALPIAWRLLRSIREEVEIQTELALQGGINGGN